MKSFLVVSQEEGSFQTIHTCFQDGYTVERAPNQDEALVMLQKRRYDFVLIDLQMLRNLAGKSDYKAGLERIWRFYPTIEVIIMSSPEKIRETVMAVKAGANNYLTYPLNPEEVDYVIKSTYGSTVLQSELDHLRDQFWQIDSLALVRTKSASMQKLFDKVHTPIGLDIGAEGPEEIAISIAAEIIAVRRNRSSK